MRHILYNGAVYVCADASEHSDLSHIVDTATASDIRGIGTVDDGVLTTYHVSDQPEQVEAFLRKHGNLIAAYGPKGTHAELGPGLYFSGAPSYWISRSKGKWEFLTRLSADQLERLISFIREEVERLNSRRYLSSSEYERALRDLKYIEEGVYQHSLLTMFAEQPYNIRFWEADQLAALGIAPSSAPRALKVRIRGKLAELRRTNYDPALFRQLRKLGVVGAYTKASMSSNPELVLWDSSAVVSTEIVDI